MDYNILANVGTVLSSNALGGNTLAGVTDSPIDIPGTLVGNLATVVNTKTYMEQTARYNNYLTYDLPKPPSTEVYHGQRD